ncbi:hypothetical protein AL1T_23730 [Acinetobacter lwoffii]|nr:hypothetical protein AL1T_23730 [Acinetobacter lwoffii]
MQALIVNLTQNSSILAKQNAGKASLFTQTVALIFLNLFRATEVASDDAPEQVKRAILVAVPD